MYPCIDRRVTGQLNSPAHSRVNLRSVDTKRILNTTPADESAAIAALTLAFGSDPAVRWMYPEPERYLAHFRTFVRAFAGGAFERGTAYVLPSAMAAALWLPPGVEPNEDAVVSVVQSSVRAEQLADLFEVFEQMGQAHPTGPHWYLPLIGVDPAQQRQGHGSTLLAATLAACDRDRLPAYLEATSPVNIPLYERHGFRVIGTIQAGASPRIFPMLRSPR